MTGKTLSIRINDDYFQFLSSLAKEEKASKIAGVSISKMLDIFSEYGVQANLEYEDYLKGLKTLRKVW
jgi:hypothetical protein